MAGICIDCFLHCRRDWEQVVAWPGRSSQQRAVDWISFTSPQPCREPRPLPFCLAYSSSFCSSITFADMISGISQVSLLNIILVSQMSGTKPIWDHDAYHRTQMSLSAWLLRGWWKECIVLQFNDLWIRAENGTSSLLWCSMLAMVWPVYSARLGE